MKELFVNNTGKKLLEENSFFIADTSGFPASIVDYTFIRDIWGTLYLVSFADADAVNPEYRDGIGQALDAEISAIKQNTGNAPIVYMKIFVTDYTPTNEDIDSIMSLYRDIPYRNALLVPSIVSLGSDSIVCSRRKYYDRAGVYKALEASLSSKRDIAEMYDLKEIYRGIRQRKSVSQPAGNGRGFRPYMTYGIIIANIAVFIAMTLSGGSESAEVLIRFGAKVNPLISGGQWWRLLASAFIHIGFMHIAFNMFGLYNMGPLVERVYGHRRYLLIYLISAVSGSFCSYLFSPYISAGASGAIFGLFGALLYLRRRKPGIFSGSFWLNLLIVLGFNLFYGFSNSGIDNFAHLGGLIGGFVSSYAFRLPGERRPH